MIHIFIYYVIPVTALIAVLWSNRSLLVNLFIKENKNLVSTTEYDKVIKNPAVQFALKWRNDNHGTKQKETVFRENGKAIISSASYKSLQDSVFN